MAPLLLSITKQILLILKTVCPLPVLYPPILGDNRDSKPNHSEKKCIEKEGRNGEVKVTAL